MSLPCPKCGSSTVYVEFRDTFLRDPANPPKPNQYGKWIVCHSCGHEEGEQP